MDNEGIDYCCHFDSCAYGFWFIEKSLAILNAEPLSELLFSTSWKPFQGEFGFFPFIMGTIWVTCVALIISVPFSLFTAIYLSEYASPRMREWVKPFIDLLAGIPSVIYGVWGVLAIIPLIKNYIAPFFGVRSTGYSVLAGGIVLAIMIFPFIVNILIEVFQSIPRQMKEVSLALGATQWETIKFVTLKKAMPGLVAVIMLGLSRAFGETMAVLMVTGNVAKIPHSIFSPAYPLPALIANNYGELLTIPLYDSALLFSALLLLVVVLFFNVMSKVILRIIEKRMR